ncbi:MAG TPA: hypothetical protein VN750_09470 [Steroidobacteraceae bacterium]|nr:hypothetical protein [Steroidobacteraceae bacterium]
MSYRDAKKDLDGLDAKILAEAGVLGLEKQGRERLYRLQKNSLNAARYWFTSFDN